MVCRLIGPGGSASFFSKVFLPATVPEPAHRNSRRGSYHLGGVGNGLYMMRLESMQWKRAASEGACAQERTDAWTRTAAPPEAKVPQCRIRKRYPCIHRRHAPQAGKHSSPMQCPLKSLRSDTPTKPALTQPFITVPPYGQICRIQSRSSGFVSQIIYLIICRWNNRR